MKSRISFCNGPVLRKDFGRFAPAWLLYTACLLLGMLMLAGDGTDYWFSYNIAMGISGMAIVNCAYAAITALLLFGDLTNTGLCNAIHALPLRRETWFFTHILSGLLFSVIPTVIMTVPAVILSTQSSVTNGWQIPLYWLLGTNLQYLFFFGTAVFSMMLSGSRMGTAVIYCMIHFAAFLAYYVAEIVYIPHLYGVVGQVAPFLIFSPVAMMVSMNFISTEQIRDFQQYASDGSENYLLRGTFTVTDNWIYLYLCATIGIVLLLVALVLYKKRKLERAGDLMATKKLEPLFMALFALMAGSLLQLLYVAFTGYGSYGDTTYLWAGLVIGWFAGLMLLRRSSRVFSWKSFLGLGLVAALLGASLVLNSMDIFGITRWLPQAEEVKSVTLGLSYINSVTLEEPEDIRDVIRLHQLACESRLEGELGAVNRPVELGDGAGTLVEIRYEMLDGSFHAREYIILVDSEAGEITRNQFSSIEAIFNGYYYSETLKKENLNPEGLLSMVDTPTGISISGTGLGKDRLTKETAEALVLAIIADSEAGNLVQHSAFHPEPVLTDEAYDIQCWSYSLYIDFPENRLHLDVFSDSTHLLQELEKLGLTQQFHEHLKAGTNG